jgi:hypothetical protein
MRLVPLRLCGVRAKQREAHVNASIKLETGAYYECCIAAYLLPAVMAPRTRVQLRFQMLRDS